MDGWMDGWIDGTSNRDAGTLSVVKRHCTHWLLLVPPHITMHFVQDEKHACLCNLLLRHVCTSALCACC